MHSATVATSAGATPTACIPERSTGSPMSWLADQARPGSATVLTSSTTVTRRQAVRTAARSAARSVRPVAKTSTASAAPMPSCRDSARPGPGAAIPAAATTTASGSRKRSAASAADPAFRPAAGLAGGGPSPRICLTFPAAAWSGTGRQLARYRPPRVLSGPGQGKARPAGCTMRPIVGGRPARRVSPDTQSGTQVGTQPG